ncbi:hypothetical protein KKB10_04480 [Patescibacteria group bacterium]|nr:hypothetical protein [Patescibacteria group bacterium]MBU1951331.1 hypothetical protein [Patescibacteria group bacterium]
MPQMRDTVPIPGSMFVMNVCCQNCGSTKFQSEGCGTVRCIGCRQYFIKAGEGYGSTCDLFYSATWYYDPVPPQATNL